MKWLLIAVITAVVAVIGALVTFKLFSRRKEPKKTLFKKTYATGATRETKIEAAPSQSKTEPSPMEAQPVQTAEEKTNSGFKAAETQHKTPDTALPPIAPVAEISTADAAPSKAVARSIAPAAESLQPAAALAQASAEADETEPAMVRTAAEVTEVDPESDSKEEMSSQTKQSSHFITEIESEPLEQQAESSREDVEKPPEKKSEESQLESKPPKKRVASKPAKALSSPTDINAVKDEKSREEIKTDTATEAVKATEKPDVTAQIDPSDSFFETLNSGKLDDWIALTQTPLTREKFQAVVHKIAKATYPKRKNKKMRKIFSAQAQRYIDEVEIKTPADSISEYIYKSLAIVLQEDQKFEKAIDLCIKAINLKMDDGTKTGYPGRIERLKKAQENKK